MKLTQVLCCSEKVGKMTKQYSNLPDSYIKRAMEQVGWRTPKALQYRQGVEVKRKKFHFAMHRPWTREFYEDNSPGTLRAKVFVEPIKEWSFFRGDRVEVLVGKDKGKQGLVNYIIQERNWVTVEGLNCTYRNVGVSGDFPGMLIREEAPLLVTNEVALVDPSDEKPTVVEWRFTEEGEKVRVSKRTGRILPMPKLAEETYDFKTKKTYYSRDKDTVGHHVAEITFSPKLKTFEMDVMDEMEIEEDRVPVKSYWY